MGRVEGKIILLTGGAMGLGKAAAKRLIAEGARVIITDHNVEAGQKTALALGENAVLPGAILTPNVQSVADASHDPDALLQQFALAQPVGYMGEPDDIAHLVVYLASDESKFATGASFAVDGGLSI